MRDGEEAPRRVVRGGGEVLAGGVEEGASDGLRVRGDAVHGQGLVRREAVQVGAAVGAGGRECDFPRWCISPVLLLRRQHRRRRRQQGRPVQPPNPVRMPLERPHRLEVRHRQQRNLPRPRTHEHGVPRGREPHRAHRPPRRLTPMQVEPAQPRLDRVAVLHVRPQRDPRLGLLAQDLAPRAGQRVRCDAAAHREQLRPALGVELLLLFASTTAAGALAVGGCACGSGSGVVHGDIPVGSVGVVKAVVACLFFLGGGLGGGDKLAEAVAALGGALAEESLRLRAGLQGAPDVRVGSGDVGGEEAAAVAELGEDG